MRELPKDDTGAEIQPPQVAADLTRTGTLTTQVRRYELITPLFGGGVEPGANDPEMLIRGTSVRGQLRFWWRACRGGGFGGNRARMKEAEDRLWGAASTPRRPRPSEVQVEVKVTDVGQEEQPFQHGTRPNQQWRDVAYAAFPLQGTNERPTPGRVRSGVAFTLTLVFPRAAQADVEAALWAWETFGGIGARTRRGFGALRLMSVDGAAVTPPPTGGVAAGIAAGLTSHVSAGLWPNDVPHLDRAVVRKIKGMYNSPREAWGFLTRQLKAFRQVRYPGSAPPAPGRSKWPEPDEIRRQTGRVCLKHATPRSTVTKFPRAEFGLPIIFHFKDEGLGDPHDTSLEGRDYDRLASPLILRPLACANGKAVALAVVLQGTQLPALQLKGAPGNPTVHADLTATEAAAIPPLGGTPDVLAAFLNSL